MLRIQFVPGKTASCAFRLTSFSPEVCKIGDKETEKINRREDNGDQKSQFPIQLLFKKQGCHESDNADYACC